ncbi:hypothetical protein PsYK624_122990 [Phanerochaete sordida]|uniref:Zinc finger PHD-type domain-containing protein n=1 Tax=Phanerochaete sordida TaxID=48140 RepID=A0A9P3GJV1_9APHY|nr:hypothetical protein PsYK624_122990 [Phanerochaete sordida]
MTKGKQKDRVTSFTVDSTRRCDACNRDITIGLGGEHNWTEHLRSKQHKNAVSAAADPKKATKLTNWLVKKSAAAPAVVRTVTAGPARLSSTLPAKALGGQTGKQTVVPDVVDLTQEPAEDEDLPSPLATASPPLIARLREAIQRLPSTVPLAQPQDILARFAGSPRDAIPAGEDVWEVLDQVLNNVIGYDTSTADVAGFIRRGPHGVDALCRWIEECIVDLKIAEALLEGKVNKVIDAIHLLVDESDVQVEDQGHSSASAEANAMPTPSPLARVPYATARTSSSGSGPFTVATRCLGYHLVTPGGQPPLTSYPAAIERLHTVPWIVLVRGTRLYLQSKLCTGYATPAEPTCSFCKALHINALVQGIRERNEHGAHEKTNWAYLTLSHCFDAMSRKNQQLDGFRLSTLNLARSALRRARQMTGWKRVALKVAQDDTPGVQKALSIAVKIGYGFRGVLHMLDRAAQHIYKPKSYAEADFHRSYLIWKLGGAAAAKVAHRALGLPSIDTTRRHVATKPVRASASFPIDSEMLENLNAAFRDLPIPTGAVLGLSIPVDEIKVQSRLRWEAATNLIHGLCREHVGDCVLEFKTMAQADYILSQLQAGNIHFASEATVIAACILTGDSSLYAARPFVVSGTCKHEQYPEHARLLKMAIHAVSTAPELSPSLRLYCLATDGESRRCRALLDIAYITPLAASSPIFPLLSPLSLFNTICGEDDITIDFDYKHCFKRLRNTLLRSKGLQINGVSVTSAVLHHHIVEGGTASTSTAAVLLSPNDKQDVTLAYRLLYALVRLKPLDEQGPLLSASARRTLCLLGELYGFLLDAYTDVRMSLQQQLTNLSAGAHILLALYALDRGNFLPVQLFHDLIWQIKTVFLCVCKAKIDNPDGQFFIILLGTDSLEDVFGKVRSMIGTDSNADVLQLTNRVDGAVQCVRISAIYPEYIGEARRLQLKPLREEDDTRSSSDVDHISPRSWKGDVFVANVVPLTAWQQGRVWADGSLQRAEIASPFRAMEDGDGFDMLCPFGGNRPVLIHGSLASGEREEDEEERDIAVQQPDITATEASSQETAPGLDVDDLAGCEAAALDASEDASNTAGGSGRSQKVSAYVHIDGSTKPRHKGAVMGVYSRPFEIIESKDRLKRIQATAQYEEQSCPGREDYLTGDNDEGVLSIEDPIVTVLQVNNLYFTAIVQLTRIILDGVNVQFIRSAQVSEPNVSFRGRIMVLIPRESSHQPDGPDWEWSGAYASSQDVDSIQGILVEPIDPDMLPAALPTLHGRQTIAIRTTDLQSIGALIFERAQSVLHLAPSVKPLDAFPYRISGGEACFLCETEVGTRGTQPDRNRCPHCPAFRLADVSAPIQLRHIGAHILHDPKLKGVESACGWCLRVGLSCAVYIRKNSRGGYTVDTRPNRSRCLGGVRTFSIKAAAKFSDTSPCTNHPIVCRLCPAGSPAVWKYNFESHLRSAHSGITIEQYASRYKLELDMLVIDSREITLMKRAYEKRRRHSKNKKKILQTLKISEEHTTRLAIRSSATISSTSVQADPDYAQANETPNGPADMSESEQEMDAFASDLESETSVPLNLESGPSTASNLESGVDISSPPPIAMPSSSGGVLPQQADEAHEESSFGITAGSSPNLAPEGLSIDPLPTDGLRRTKRKTTAVVAVADPSAESICLECEELLDADTAVTCDGLLCTNVYHLACRGLLERPIGGWFCDDECTENAGFRVTKRRRARK